MKAIKLLAPMGFGFKKSLTFKWEWAVFYETLNGEPYSQHFDSRAEARRYRRGLYFVKKIKIKRRLVQTSWENYNDSFTWNAGCGRR